MTIDAFLVQLAPELILLVGACAVLIAGVMKASSGGRWVSPITLIVVLAALLATLLLGVPDGTQGPPGLWLTSLTFYTRCIALAIGALIVLVNWHQPVTEERGEYMSMILFSLLGVLLTASANDLLVLFFAIELVSVPTYVLIGLSREDSRASEAAVKYFFLGAMSAAILAYGLSFLYGAAGTTTIYALNDGAAVSNLAFGADMGSHALIGLVLVFSGLAFKVAAVPFHVYAADVYEGAASPVTGLLGFVPKFAGFVALVKIFAACNWEMPDSINWMIWVVAAATMTAGNVLALLQKNVKRMLAYSSVAHAGYILVGLAAGTTDGYAGALFYLLVYSVMNIGAFGVSALLEWDGKEGAEQDLDSLAGMGYRKPLLGWTMVFFMFGLAGFPPLGGFFGKVAVFAPAIDAGLVWLAIAGVLTSAVSAFYYLRVLVVFFMKTPEPDTAASRATFDVPGMAAAVLVLCVVLLIVLGLAPGLIELTGSFFDSGQMAFGR